MRILLAEHEQKLAEFAARNLRSEGFAVEHAATIESVDLLAKSTGYDLVILDLLLPGAPGASPLRRLRRQCQDTPVLILTTRGRSDIEIEDFDADDCLAKPFAIPELLIRVRALMRRGPAAKRNALKLADLELDRATREVCRSEQRIELTAKEYSLLEYLLLNPGLVLSRSKIIDRVWGKSLEGRTDIVDAHVRRLRRKIDDRFEPQLIRTVRGLGYAIDLEQLS